MKKYLIIAAFLILMEYQVLFHYNPSITPEIHLLDYSLVTGLGLLGLAFYHILGGLKGFHKNIDKKRFIKRKYWLPITVFYVFMLSVGAFFADSIERRLIMILIIMAAALISFSIYEIQTHPKEQRNSRIGTFTVPIIFLYAINFLLAVQIDQNIAYQFILILTSIVLFDLLKKEEQFSQIKINHEELRHYIFHRWDKYFSLFLFVWYFINLHLNGSISVFSMLGLLFLFMVIYFTILLRVTYKFTTKFFVGILLLAGALTAIPALIFLLTTWRPPAFAVAAFIFLGFDVADIYWHHLRFGDDHNPPVKFWIQKAAIYLLVVLFIWQLEEISLNPFMDFDTVYTSTLGEAGTTIAEPTIHVPDAENAFHVRGE